MSERFANYARSIGTGAAVGAGLGLVGIGTTVLRNHRELTHRTVTLHPVLQMMCDAEQRSDGMNPSIWGAVHGPHHAFRDTKIASFYETSHRIQWLESQGLETPETYAHLDPFVDVFSRADVLEIGAYGDQYLRERMGDRYREPDYSQEDPEDTYARIQPAEPQYQYPKYQQHTGEWTQSDIANIVLTDPTSAALCRPRKGWIRDSDSTNGVRGVMRSNVFLYKAYADVFRDNPDLMPDYLKEADNRRSMKPEVWGSTALIVGGAMALRAARQGRDFRAEDLLIGALAGGVARGVKVGTKIAGGNFINAIGHAADIDNVGDFYRALVSHEYQIRPNADGTLTTDVTDAGLVGKLFKYLTLDEGNQDAHHKEPENNAFTLEHGMERVMDAPFGSFVDYLARNTHVPFIQPGDQFNLPPGARRPDDPNPAVLLIEQRRVEQMSRAA